MAAESAFQIDAVSPKGAIGLMQLMPETAQLLGADPHDPAQNVDAGVRYLRDLLNKYDGGLWRALAAYNAGPAAVDKYHWVPPYRETIDWMYSSPDALKIYSEYSGVPTSIVQRVLKLIPKDAVETDQVKDLDGVMADAVAQKFLAAPLTPDQVKELVQIPK